MGKKITGYHLAWENMDTTADSRDYRTNELGKAIEAFACVSRYRDTLYVRLAECTAVGQTDMATFQRDAV